MHHQRVLAYLCLKNITFIGLLPEEKIEENVPEGEMKETKGNLRICGKSMTCILLQKNLKNNQL
jgi:hypothetical protein